MDIDWCLAELRQMQSGLLARSSVSEFGTHYTLAETDQVLHTWAQVVDQILDRVVPEWREHAPIDPTAGRPRWKHHRRWVTQAIAALERQGEVEVRLGSPAPSIAIDDLHPWVWTSAEVAWSAGSYSDAIRAVARAINAKTRQKLNRRDLSEWKLLNNAFSTRPPTVDEPRLRLSSPDNADTFENLHKGAGALAQGLYQAVRNPMNHESEEDLDRTAEMPEHLAVERLAAFSLLARFIDQADVETAE